MQLGDAVRAVLESYPKVFFACHRRHVRDERRGTTLSSHQASILDHLDEVEPIGLTDLARHLGVTPSTTSLAIDRLERDGYVVRERAAVDGRRVELRLTAAGGSIKERDKVLDPDLLRDLLRRLDSGEVERVVEGLGLLARAAREAMQDRSERKRVGSMGGGRRQAADRRTR
jgi:DNA-binding MarR family transcriptional regulator